MTRSYRVVALLEEAVGSLKDAELAARAFIITGDTWWEYDAVPMRMAEVFDSLRGTVVDQQQRRRVEALAIAADIRQIRLLEQDLPEYGLRRFDPVGEPETALPCHRGL